MSYNILFPIIIATLVQAQLNGEFWWLDGKLNNIKKVKPTPPNIEISDFENEEEDRSRIIFRDDDFFTNTLKPFSDRTSKLVIPNKNINDKTIQLVWPTEEHMKNHDVEVFTTPKYKDYEKVKPIKIQKKHEDVLVFSYPKNEKFVTIEKNKASTESTITTLNKLELSDNSGAKINAYASKLSTMPTTTKQGESQNICTYTAKKKCYEFNGFVYDYARRIPASFGDEPLICCILPIQPILNGNNLSDTVHFPQTSSLKRYKRSEPKTNISLKQRDFLLNHKFTMQQQHAKPASTPLTKIVTPTEDDYVDPYLNIKNTKVQPPIKVENTKYSDYSEDSQEYAEELPKPGLIGLYSDLAQSPSSWPFSKGNNGFGYGVSYNDYEEEDEEEDTFGYATIDPRKNTNQQKHKVMPQKVTPSDEVAHDAERHTINFQSDPDFNVFQGFKLLNLFRNTSRVHTKKTSNQDTDVLVSAPDDSEENEEVFDVEQMFDDCGNVVKKVNEKDTNQQKHKVMPQKVTPSDEVAHDAERHTINFQSDPDFHVFQGFKLLNLFRNTSRVHTKKTSNQDTDVLVSAPDDSEAKEEVFDVEQMFDDCGYVVKKVDEKGNQIGEAGSGSHPWLALVVLTKSRHNVLCYATLVHPKAAVTIADCIQGTAPGDVTVIAGVWDLTEKSRSKNRVATVQIHPDHKPGDPENNLAFLHWMAPLKLSANVQPACLGYPEIGEECKLFGWGRLDQGTQQPRSRWQRALVRACTRPGTKKRTRLPTDVFCVSTSRGTVTGIGGPLICEVAGHSSIVGVVVSRDNGYVLSPVRDWAMKLGTLVSGD